MNYDLTLRQCCLDVKMSLYFGMFLTLRQTDEEIRKGETIEDNGIGWNAPDSHNIDILISLINEHESNGKIIITNQLIDYCINSLFKKLYKYKKQYKVFQDRKPFTETTIIPKSDTQTTLFNI